MPDPRERCVSLTDDASRRLLAEATRLMLPVTAATAGSLPFGAETRREAKRLLDWSKAWVDPSLLGSGIPGLKVPSLDGDTTHRIWPPIAPGELMIGREAWRLGYYQGALIVEYRADGERTEVVGDLVLHLDAINDETGRWRSPQTMPAALARHRKLVTAVDVMPVREIPEATWIEAGFRAQPEDCHFCQKGICSAHQPAQGQAENRWERDHGPGSWERDWCWVIGMEVEP